MKNSVIFLILFSLCAFPSCEKGKQFFGGKDKVEELILTNLTLEQKIREDSVMHLQELNMLRDQYEKEIAQMKATPTFQRKDKGYFVVVGSFRQAGNAEKYSSHIKSLGYEGALVDGPARFTLVTSGTYADYKQAAEAYRIAREKLISSAWIYVKK